MSAAVTTLLHDFATRNWAAQPFERLVALAQTAPQELSDLVAQALQQTPEGGTHIDLVLGLLDDDAFQTLLGKVLPGVAQWAGNGVAASLLTYASLQRPPWLHPHLDELFTQRPVQGYYENWPWREAAADVQARLEHRLRTAADADTRLRVWFCLLELRTPQALAAAEQWAGQLPLSQPLPVWLREVGFDTATRALYRPASSHLVFAPDALAEPGPAWLNRTLHPTWRLPASGPACQLGGVVDGACTLCGGALHRLLSLPAGAVAGRDGPLTVATCLSCLGWEREALFCQHDASGQPVPLDHGHTEPEFPAQPLRELVVHLAPSPPRWLWQDWALANSRENLHRVGGFPSWIQGADYPDCPHCARAMPFILQLDSGLPDVEGNEWLWGSDGMAYVFFCVECAVSAVMWQCT